MKGLVVFNDRADIAFYSLDGELKKYMFDRMRQLEEGAGAKPEDIPNRDIRDAIGNFFLPFNMSFGVLNSFRKPVLFLNTEDGFKIVFQKFSESVYIAVSKEEVDTEETLTRELFVFSRIIGFSFGLVESQLNQSDVLKRKQASAKVASLMRTYNRLYSIDQVFLLEAVEHVHFGQLQAAQEEVVKLAKDCLESSKNGGLPNVHHAMLLVNTKLLTICGKSPQLPTADILMITLFVMNHFHDLSNEDNDDEEEEEEEGGEGPRFSQDKSDSEEGLGLDAEGEDDSGDNTAFRTPCATPKESFSRPATESEDPFESDDRQFHTPHGSMVEEDTHQFKTPNEGDSDSPSQSIRLQNRDREIKGLQSRLKNALLHFGGIGRRHASGRNQFGTAASPDQAKYLEQIVFLHPQSGSYIPHVLHCFEVYTGIVLVMITEFGSHGSGTQLAGCICQTRSKLADAVNRIVSSGGQSSFELLEENFRRINDLVRREVQATASINLKNCNTRVQNVWANLKGAGFNSYLSRLRSHSSGDTHDTRSTRIEAMGRDLMDKLVKLYEELYFAPKQQEYDASNVVSRLTKNFVGLKRDFGEFLALKGVLNIPMVSFTVDYPGMIHFIFIDRSFDEMTAPSLCIDTPVGNPYVEQLAMQRQEDSSTFLRRKIWTMVQRAQRYLALGYTSQSWLDDHFLFSYHLWINIPNNALGVPVRFFAPQNVRINSSSPPGVIGSRFYRDLYQPGAESQGYVYELYSIHQPTVPLKDAASQCKRLADELWPSSKEAIAPFSLIN